MARDFHDARRPELEDVGMIDSGHDLDLASPEVVRHAWQVDDLQGKFLLVGKNPEGRTEGPLPKELNLICLRERGGHIALADIKRANLDHPVPPAPNRYRFWHTACERIVPSGMIQFTERPRLCPGSRPGGVEGV